MLKLTYFLGRRSLEIGRCAAAAAAKAPVARNYSIEDGGANTLNRKGVKARSRRVSNKRTVGNDVDSQLEEAARAAAESMPGDKRKMKADLIGQLRNLAALGEKQKIEGQEGPSQIKNLLEGMNIQVKKNAKLDDRRYRQGTGTAEDQPRDRSPVLKSRGHKFQKGRQSYDRKHYRLFEAPPLNIFPPLEQAVDMPERGTLFDVLQKEENERRLRYPASNAYEEMMRLTEEKKTWTFPINNEQGLEADAQVGFHEHVFLDHLLKDFPQKGPIRHFMELVIVGLSKNPHITVQQKHEHVAWYGEYFSDKYAVVEDLMEAGSAHKKLSAKS